MTAEQIQRINELAKKQRTEGLTDAERDEQAALRRAYLDAIRGNVRAQLSGVQSTGNDRKS